MPNPDGAGARLMRCAARRIIVCFLATLVIGASRAAVPLGAQTASPQLPAPPADEEQPKEPDRPRGPTFVMRDHPSLRFGDEVRIDFRLKLQGDFRGFDPHLETRPGRFDLRRRRMGVQGEILDDIEFEVERELPDLPEDEAELAPIDTGVIEPVKSPWRDAYVNLRFVRRAQVRAGKFKIPFGLDQLTGGTDLDFVARSLIGSQLSPGRDIGVAVHGRFFGRGLTYEVGLFKEDGVNGRKSETTSAGRTLAGRLTIRPFRPFVGEGPLEDLEVGISAAGGDVPEGLNGFEGETVFGHTFFSPVFVRGRRLRLGGDVSWTPGPFSLKGEVIRADDERKGQSISNEDLPDAIARGWFLSGTWLVTGERKTGSVTPRKDFLTGRGPGAIEIGLRRDELRFGSKPDPDPPFRNERAANLLGNRDRVWTMGVNWYWNRFFKVQGNAVREEVQDTFPRRAPITGRSRYWSGIVRLQFVL